MTSYGLKEATCRVIMQYRSAR